jgi:hypothetical protein
VCTESRSSRESTHMPRHFFTRFFHKRCPLCKQEVHEQSDRAV